MLKKIFSFSIENPILSILLGLFILLAGIYTFEKLPIDVIPDIGENQQIIITTWEGHSVQDVEDQITYPLSVALQGLPDVKTIRGASSFGLSMVYIIFKDEADFYFTRDRIIEKLSQVKGAFPIDASMRLGPDSTGINQVFWYTLHSETRDLEELRTLQDWVVKYQLSAIDGVSEVGSIGGYKKEFHVDIDPLRLYKYQLPLKKVMQSLKASNRSVGSKTITENDMEYIVYSNAQLKTLKDIRHTVIESREDVPIFMKDIASIQYGVGYRYGVLDNGGREAVGGVITMRKGENPVKVIQGIKEKIKEIEKGLPKDIKIIPFYDRSEMIYASLEHLKSSMLHELLVTIFVVFLFLFNFIIASIILAVLPISLAATFTAMYLLKIDANIMSLAGIIIAFGAIVDLGIIFIENIYNQLKEEGISKKEAIQKASDELGGGLLIAVLTTVISFLPVFLLQGQDGKLFTPLAWTKTILLLASILFTLLLIPALSQLFLKAPKKKTVEGYIHKGITWVYARLLSQLMDLRFAFLLLPAVILGLAIYVFPKIGSEYMPPLDEGDIIFMPVTSSAISLEKAIDILRKQDEIIKSFPEVRSVVGKAGRAESAFDPAPVSMFETTIRLKDKAKWRPFIDVKEGGKLVKKRLTKKRLIQAMDEALAMGGVANIWTQPISNRIDMVSTGIRTEVGIKVFGEDLKTIEYYVQKIKKLLEKKKGIRGLYAEQIEGKPYLKIDIDRVKAARYGLKVDDIQALVEVAIGGKFLTVVYDGRKRFPVKLGYSKEIRDQLDEIKDLKLTLNNGAMIPLSSVAKVDTELGASMINSENGRLRAYVLFDIDSKDKMAFIQEIKEEIDKNIAFKTGYNYSIDGRFKQMLASKKMLKMLVPISLFLIFFLIYLLFKRLSTVLIIFTAIPMTIAGGVLFLYFMDQNISVAVWVGFIALFGIAVDDSIIIATFITQRLPFFTQKNLKQEIIQAGARRIRPLMMTTATTLLALVPLLYSDGRGSEFMRPMAIPVIGGLAFEILTLFLVPILFYMLYKRRLEKIGKIER